MKDRLGNYRVERKIADGGMGTVYLGRSPRGTPVVLKVPHAQDKQAAMALADEARAGMRLRHPAIVETLDWFVDEGVSVLVVAYIEGASLFELRQRAGPLPAPAVAEIGRAIASGLDAIHRAVDERGRSLDMLHRDVSPNNVLVDVAGAVRLIDLGIVRSSERKQAATSHGMVKGTLRYLAPEILSGGDHSAASDLWALGLTLWESAIGRYVIPGDEMKTVRAAMDGSLVAQLETAALDPALAEALAALVAPIGRRLNNARAATSVLARLTQKMPGGSALIARALVGGAGDGDEAPEHTETMVRGTAESNAATAISSRSDVDSVFTSTTGRATLAPIDTAPTLQMPIVDVVEVSDTAPTIQMPAWSPPTDPNAPTHLAMPKVELPPKPLQKERPKPAVSLFIPIVVVDDDGEEIG